MVCFPFVMSPSASFLAPSSFSWRACNGFMSSFLISETKFVGYICLESKVKDSSKCTLVYKFDEVPPETYCILEGPLGYSHLKGHWTSITYIF